MDRKAYLLVLIFCSLQSVSAWSKPLADLIDAIRPSVVAVGTYASTNNPPAQFRGTGFVVGDGLHVVTNHHVLPAVLDSEHFEQIAVFSGRGKSAVMHMAHLEAADVEHDLVLLRIEGNPLPALQLAQDAGLKEGDEIAFTGFPIGMVLGLYPVTHHGMVSAITPVVIPAASSGQLTSKMIHAMASPFDVLQLDATAYPGNSGSPVFDVRNGKIVGIVNMVFVKSTKESALSEPSGITYAIPVRFLIPMVKQLKRND
ncbi:MAG: serine protease [Parasulfuritortus sp.]|jgi:S1-C subfamily serine protease|nr:serine protease [Parasulfuritortus sp.]